MEGPPYNRRPDGPWRDSGDHKDFLPQIDLGWKRRRVQSDDGGSVALPVVLTLGVLAVVWGVRRQNAPEPLPAPYQVVQSAPAIDDERRARLQARQAEMLQAIREQRQQSAQTQAGSSINGRDLRRCVYQGVESWQTQPCPAPWYEVPAGPEGTRWARVQEEKQMRLAAEAKLAQEQLRYQSAAGGQGAAQPIWVGSQQNPATGPNSARCVQAKADRNNAYRLVGNNRSFDFIRYWNDYVFEACK